MCQAYDYKTMFLNCPSGSSDVACAGRLRSLRTRFQPRVNYFEYFQCYRLNGF